MSEGPQVLLRVQWLHRQLVGQTIIKAQTPRQSLQTAVPMLSGLRVVDCRCKGKHILIEFQDGLFLHNHLLMRGRWRREPGQMLFLPSDVWLGLYVGAATICNINGQVLEWLDRLAAERVFARLGPDAMAEPFPTEAISVAASRCDLPVAEFLLDQERVAGIGNVAKSEILFRARIDPRAHASGLTPAQIHTLCRATHDVLRESYRQGGRWTHVVYRRAGHKCPVCGAPIRLLRLPPGRRATYFCPACQGARSMP